MNIGGFISTSLIDYPGKVSCVVFTNGCNFRCPFCHNPDLVPIQPPPSDSYEMDKLFNFLETRAGLLDAVVISGGEPTLQKRLVTFLSRIKRMGFLVKLDTNGSRPQALRALLSEGFIDFVAMDIKTAPRLYVPDISPQGDPETLLQSIDAIMASAPDYEFRTTCVRPFVTQEIMAEIAGVIRGAKRYALQAFRSKTLLDPDFFDDLSAGYYENELEDLRSIIQPFVTECVIR